MNHIQRTGLFILLLTLKVATVKGQGVWCPTNIDFENNNFTGWSCETGSVALVGGVNTITLAPSAPTPGQHDITSGAGTDPYGNFPVVAPGGGLHSLKLGNDQTGQGAERITYTIRIPGGLNNFSILYKWAAVLNEGTGHTAAQQGRFLVEAIDSATNLPAGCVPAPFVATGALPGFTLSSLGGGSQNSAVYYKAWSSMSLNLSGYAGRTIFLKFTTADCTQGGHFGYAYIDVSCSFFSINGGYCPGASTVSLQAPPGFQNYSWRDSSLLNIVGSTQNVIVPAPTDTVHYFVILSPYNGYGCPDTLETLVYPSLPPDAIFSAVTPYCAKSPLQFTDQSISPPTGSYINQWNWNFGDPASGASNTSTLQNPTHTFSSPGTYTVSLFVHSNYGCGSDTEIHTIVITPAKVVDAGIIDSLCYGSSILMNATSTPAAAGDTYIWSPTAGLSSSTILNPTCTATNTSWYKLTVNYLPAGCSQTDSVYVNVVPGSPNVTATVSPDSICVGSSSQLNATATQNFCATVSGTSGCPGSYHTVGTGTALCTYPFSGFYQDGRAQFLFTAAELNAAGITAGNINGLSLWVASKTSTQAYKGLTIKIGCTNLTALTSWQTGLSIVYGPTNFTNSAAAWNNFNFTNAYGWDGVQNILVELCYDNSLSSGNDNVYYTATTFTSTIYNTSNVSGGAGCNLTGFTLSLNRPNIRFNSCSNSSLANYTWSWTPAASLANATTVSPTATPTVTTTYTATVTRGNCPSHTANVVLHVNSITLDAGLDKTVCNGVNVTMTATASAAAGPLSYLWTPATGLSATNILNPVCSVTTTTTYYLTATDIKNCSKTDSVVVHVVPPFSINADSISVKCFGGNTGKAFVTVNGQPGAYTYSWNSVPAQNTDTAFNLQAGTYTVTVSLGGCSQTSTTIVTQPNLLQHNTIYVGNNVSCFGGSNGQLYTVTPFGGVGPYTYSWNSTPMQSGFTANNLSAGTYVLTVTDSKGCIDTGLQTITQPPVISNVTASQTSAVSCNGGSDGTATVTNPTGGTPGYTYSWNTVPIQTTQAVTGLAIGTYTVTVTDTKGCTKTSSVTITQPNPLANVTASQLTMVSCFGGSNGSVTVTTPTGGTSPYSYSWNTVPVQNTKTATGLPAGTYTVTVTDAHGCPPLTSTATLTQPTALSGLTASVTQQINCNGGFNGQLTANGLLGGTPPYSYSWNSTPVQNTIVASNLATGTYTVTATDSKGCTLPFNIFLPEPTPITNVTASALSHNPCNGNSLGSATVSAPIGGTPGYTLAWNTVPVQTTTTINNLAAGIYTATYTDTKGCTKSDTVQIVQPGVLNANAIIVQPITCFGLSNAIIGSNPIGGTGPFSYSWNTTPVQTTQQVSNIGVGTYTVTVTDANNCPPDTSSVVVVEPLGFTNVVASILNNVSCFGGSNASVTVSTPGGGTPPYNYSWNSTPVQNTQTATGLPIGTYIVTVSDVNNCAIIFDTVSVTQPTALSNVTASTINNLLCFNVPIGTATVTTPTGGTPPYSFAWNSIPAQSNDTAFNLPAGNFTVTVTDANGCSLSSSTAITQPSNIVGLTATTTQQVTCFGGTNGIVQATAPTGGTSPYNYSWNTTPIQSGLSANGLSAGSYTITLTDGNGCIKTSSTTVTQPQALGNVIASVLNNVSCFGGNNSIITCTTPTGGTQPYSFSWNTTPIQTNDTAFNVQAGTYTVSVTDFYNCATLTSTVTVTEPSALSNVTATLIKPVPCFGGNNGIAGVTTPMGGTPPYSYTWNTTPIQNNDSALNLIAGTYSITVTDSQGCFLTSSVVVPQPAFPLSNVITQVIKNVSCFGGSDGIITVTNPTGGTPPYSYSWNTSPSQTNQIANNLPAGFYTVNVDDANGCGLSAADSITQPSPLTNVNASIIHGVNCFGFNDGILTTTLPTGGTPPYTYAWNTTPMQSTQSATNVPAGTYGILVMDAKFCFLSDTVTLIQPPAMSNVAIAFSQNISCFGGTNGMAAVTPATGGTPPYTIAWNTTPVQTNDTATGLTANNYTVTVTDIYGCYLTATTTITEPTDIIPLPSSSTPAICANNIGTATCYYPSGGVPPYTYSWNTQPPQTSPIATNLAPGNYLCILTDMNGCSKFVNATVGQTGGIDPLVVTSTDVNCFGNSDGTAHCATPTGGTVPYNFTWNNNPTHYDSTVTGLSLGIYNLTVTDLNGCVAYGSVTINQPAALVLGEVTTRPTTCEAIPNGEAQLANITGGTAPYSTVWKINPDQYGNIAANLAAGSYTLEVTDSKGCAAMQVVTINFDPFVVVNAGLDATITTGDAYTLNASVDVNPSTPFNYLWQDQWHNNLGNTSSVTVAPNRDTRYIIYAFPGTDTICAVSDTVEIFVKECTEIYIPNAFTPNGDGLDDIFKLNNVDDFEGLVSFEIFNRWGQKVYYGTNKNSGWDGQFNGKDAEMDTYVYYVTVQCYGGKLVSKKGTLTLVR